ncbi:MAG: SRPBCC domain-containing protein [Candidatus Micrarchaeota archaeon]|nr:SRPBCC domain-containing protein [Candidatus Micrarchaeota archaeon]
MGKELVVERIFDVPRERVWKAWTTQKEIMKWWGPRGFTAPFITIDFKVGGKYLYCMRASDEIAKAMGGQKDFWNTGKFKEIVPHSKIVATTSFSDEKGNVIPASTYGMSADMALEAMVTVTFNEVGGKTKLTVRYMGLPDEMIDRARQGWNESLDKLGEALGN